MIQQPLSWRAVLAAVLALVGAGMGVGIALDDDGLTIRVGKTVTVQDKVTSSEKKEIVAETPPAGDLQADPKVLRDETPASVPERVLEQAEDAAEEYVDDANVAPVSDPVPVAGAQGYSCRKDFQTRGVGAFRAVWFYFTWHFTVSANRPGWGDVYAIRDYLASVGLSATFIIDAEGNCLQTAPLNRNPQTQGWFNQYSVSVEIIATGKETRAEWLVMPLIKDGILAALTRDHLLGANLPLRFVDPVGCPTKVEKIEGGATDHDALECGNNHWDVGEEFPFDVVLGQMKARPCGRKCERRRELRAKHQRTHRRVAKRNCSAHQGPGYCGRLRNRNKAVHLAAKREGISLKGTYR